MPFLDTVNAILTEDRVNKALNDACELKRIYNDLYRIPPFNQGGNDYPSNVISYTLWQAQKESNNNKHLLARLFKLLNLSSKDILADTHTRAKHLALILSSAVNSSKNNIHNGNVIITPDCMTDLVQALSSKKKISAQDISSAIYGLGSFAKQEHDNLLSKVDPLHIANLVKALLELSQSAAKDIVKTLYGLALLAKHGYDKFKLLSQVDSGHIAKLVHKLLTKKSDSQMIANIFYSIGIFAQTEHGWLLEQINPLDIADLVKNLSTLKPNAQDIANMFYDLGELVRAGNGNLLQKISSNDIANLVEMLTKKQLEALEIMITFYGLGILAQHERDERDESGNLLSQVAPKYIANLVTSLLGLEKASNARNIAKTLYDLGELAKSGQTQLLANITPGMIASLFKAFTEKESNAKEREDAFYGLCMFAKHSHRHLLKQTSAQFNAQYIAKLVQELSGSDKPTSQSIANIFNGLCELAKAGYKSLLEKIKNTDIDNLVEKLLVDEAATAQNIANMATALVYLRRKELDVIESFFYKLKDKIFNPKIKEQLNIKSINALDMYLGFMYVLFPTEKNLLEEVDICHRYLEKIKEPMKKNQADEETVSSDAQQRYIGQLQAKINKETNGQYRIETEYYNYGYSLDAVIFYQDKPIYVVEIDGAHHYHEGSLRKQDCRRDKVTEKTLGCDTWRYKVSNTNIEGDILKLWDAIAIKTAKQTIIELSSKLEERVTDGSFTGVIKMQKEMSEALQKTGAELKSKFIKNTIISIAKLTKANYTNLITAEQLGNLVQALSLLLTTPKAQDIANIFYSLGTLAKYGDMNLLSRINQRQLQALYDKFPKNEPANSEDIERLNYGKSLLLGKKDNAIKTQTFSNATAIAEFGQRHSTEKRITGKRKAGGGQPPKRPATGMRP